MFDNYILFLKIGIIKELRKQGVITTEEEIIIIKELEKGRK